MAKAKKEAALTPEERLQAALVPDWEWPYKLPENWCWTNHNTLIDISGGAQPDKSFFVMHPTNGYVQLYQTRDYGEHPIPVYIPTKYATKTTKEGDILLARYGGSLGKVFRAHDGAYNVALAKVINLFPQLVDNEFLYHYYLSSFYQDFCVKAGSGRSAQAGFNRNDLSGLPFPLPPLAEQRRIVDRIESLFAKLDEAKEKAQAVVDSFETRKAAILHKAFTGELTANWREEHGVGMESWETKRFDSVAAIRSNLVDPADYQSFPHIAPDNIEKKTGVLLEYHTIAEDGMTSGKHRFYPGQILYSKIRPYLSKVIVVDFDGLCSADMYPIEAYQNAKCLWYYMLSEEFLLQASTAGSRSVLPKINQKELSALTVHLPTNDEEQEEIVHILDNLFAKEQQAKEAAEAVLDQIDLMKKSILARAFRGELGTNDPADEPAMELLKKVLDIPAEPKPKAQRKFIPKELDAQIKTDLERKIIKAFIQNETDVLSIKQLMSVSSKKFDVMEALRSLQNRGILIKENDTYKLMG